MPDDPLVEVRGVESLRELHLRLKEAGEGGLRRQLNKAIRAAAKPAIDAAKASASASLPRSGGLAGLIAGSKFATVIKTGSQSAGVSIKAAAGHDIAALDQGSLRHLTWGHKPWVAQAVTPGWFTRPIADRSPAIAAGIDEALAATAAQIAGK